MKRLVAATYLMIALIGPSLARDVAAVGKKAKPKQSSECRPVGTVKGTKLWAGNCVAPEPMAAPVAEPESEPETTGAIRGGKEYATPMRLVQGRYHHPPGRGSRRKHA